MATRRRRVVWTDQARWMLDDAVAYIARDSPPAAERLLVLALDAASSLDSLCGRGRIVTELDHPILRELFLQRYRLNYEVTPDEVQSVAFLHGARDLTRWRPEG